MGQRSKHQQGNWIRAPRRSAIYARDNHTCQWCGKDSSVEPVQLTLDHIVAKSAGGSNDCVNLITACAECNSYRRDMSAPAFARHLGDTGCGNSVDILKRIRRQANRACYSPVTGMRFANKGKGQ